MANLRRPTIWIIFALLAFAVASSLFCLRRVSAYRQTEEQEALWAGSVKVGNFAGIARSWLARGSRDLVLEAARWMLVLDTFYVQIALGDTFEIDERSPTWSGDVSMIAARERSLSVERRYVRDGSLTAVDVMVPYESFTSPGETAGYVRIGVNASGVEEGIREYRRRVVWVAVGGNMGLWLLGFAGCLVLRRRNGFTGVADSGAHEHRAIEVADLRIDPATREVTMLGQPIALTPKQFALLQLLASEPGRVHTDREIVEAVWPASAYADAKDVKQCIYTIRQRLKPVHSAPLALIVNVQGHGYKLDPAAASVSDPNLIE